MPNNLQAIMAKILARALMTLREQAVMPRLVNGSYSNEAAEKGDTIDVPVPTGKTASDVTPSNVPPVTADETPQKVQIPLDQWKHSNFKLSDKEMVEIDRNRHFMPMQMAEAVRALSNEVNLSILREYKGVYGFVGTPGTTPFATNTDAAVQARRVLHSQLCPRDNRRFVMDFDAEANALALAAFQDVDKAGDTGVKREGEVGRKFGFDMFTDDHVLRHVSTPLTAGAATVNGAHAAGVKVINIAKATNASPLVEGDILTFAGDAQTYVVTAGANLIVGNTNVSISPALKVAKAGGEAMTLKESHVVNLAFHRDAFAFANRPLVQATSDLELGNRIISLTDPQTGITLRLEVERQHKQTVWDLDILWGKKLVRPELACRIAG